MIETRRVFPAKTDLALGWSAVLTAGLALFAWAACCVLPLALSVAGLSLAGTAWIAGERRWLTAATVVVLAAGWWSVVARRRRCAADSSCAPPSRLSVALLGAATVLATIALAWGPLIEPRLLTLLRTWR